MAATVVIFDRNGYNNHKIAGKRACLQPPERSACTGPFLAGHALPVLSFLWKKADVLLRASRWKNKLKHHRFDRKKECTEPMKKSCLIAVITALAAVAGALAAVAVYLRRREKELDEYERLLFGEDDADTVEPEAADEAPAEDAAE